MKVQIRFYKQKFISKLLKLSTQAMHIDMGTFAKIFGMSASEFKVKMRVIGWIYQLDLIFFLRCPTSPFASKMSLDGPQQLKRSRIGDRIVSLQENNEILMIIYEKTEINET